MQAKDYWPNWEIVEGVKKTIRDKLPSLGRSLGNVPDHKVINWPHYARQGIGMQRRGGCYYQTPRQVVETLLNQPWEFLFAGADAERDIYERVFSDYDNIRPLIKTLLSAYEPEDGASIRRFGSVVDSRGNGNQQWTVTYEYIVYRLKWPEVSTGINVLDQPQLKAAIQMLNMITEVNSRFTSFPESSPMGFAVFYLFREASLLGAHFLAAREEMRNYIDKEVARSQRV